ncbi:MAG: Holliday junction branch migration protein RuvA [Candidatus Paceibacterota bacterium]|jgi:Holliday junction DNA helicase RuvA
MFSYISGIVTDKDARKAVLENRGIGFEIFCSAKTLGKLIIGKEAKIYVFLNVSERALDLYGFLTKTEKDSFDVLNNVSGIGPKIAMGLASIGSMEKIKEDLEKGKVPCDVKGLGQKRLQKILLELTGKIKDISRKSGKKSEDQDDALSALISLGFPRQEAKEALSSLPLEIEGAKERVKQALKILGGK